MKYALGLNPFTLVYFLCNVKSLNFFLLFSNGGYQSSGYGAYGGRGGSQGGGGYGGPRGGGGSSWSKDSQPGENLRRPKWDTIKLLEFEKNFYKEHSAVTKRSAAEVETFLKENDVSVRGRDVPRPVFNFNEAGLPGKLTLRPKL